MIRRLAFWGAASTLAITYVGFPALTALRAQLVRRPVRVADITPSVSVVIAARNEAGMIGPRIDNLLALDYPPDRLEIVVASDGSTDGTDEIVASYADRGVRLVSPGRVGKGAALGAAVAAASGDILVFSDANSRCAPGAVRALVRPLADPSVGGVAGNQVYLDADGGSDHAAGERGYWDLDRLIKRAQSASGSVTSGTGAIYAIRRELFEPIPEGVTDDMLNTIRVVDRRLRLVFAEDAVAYESVAPSSALEFDRKVRIMTRSFSCLLVMRRLFDPRRTGFYAAQLFWHKVLLRATAVPLAALLVTAPLLWRHGLVYRVATIGQAVSYALAAAGLLLGDRPAARSKPLAVPAYYVLVNTAAVRAAWNLVRSAGIDRWEPRRAAGDGLVPFAESGDRDDRFEPESEVA